MNSTLNFIGLEKDKVEKLSKNLNNLLADYQIFYQNLRGFHWNIKGENFFELHEKFEELYKDIREKIDEIAERILTIDGQPLHTISDYCEISEIKEAKNIEDGREAVEITLNGFQIILAKQRSIMSQAQEADDEGTITLISDYIANQEKTAWMLKSWLR
ncbi:Dps family protein [Marinigracilibium pacificum]|uniref:DNA starvation/stationary phase protection protein n=1 Tax=Marinigracilibium pacificum TaxID=2729599 RepID=A0A848IWQ5_9BACT|nr:Dps family protein [Marinigracilibium pacificum]NMM48963.1 DNA starvation/stationary phase protection protein [Marinigracilibium pacificum]